MYNKKAPFGRSVFDISEGGGAFHLAAPAEGTKEPKDDAHLGTIWRSPEHGFIEASTNPRLAKA